QGREVAAAGRATLPVLFPRDRVIAVGVASLSVAPRENASAVTESNVLLNPFGNFVRINVLVLSEIEHWPEDHLRPGHRPRTSEPALDRAASEHGSRGNPIALDADRRNHVAVLSAPRVAVTSGIARSQRTPLAHTSVRSGVGEFARGRAV